MTCFSSGYLLLDFFVFYALNGAASAGITAFVLRGLGAKLSVCLLSDIVIFQLTRVTAVVRVSC